MSLVSLFSFLLIACGAAVMAVCVIRFGPEIRKLKLVSEQEYRKIKPFATFHIGLMIFFLIGYVVVGLSIILNIRIIGEFFVGAIFFFGAVFVLLGIQLQSRMAASLKHLYDEAILANQSLESERGTLSSLNNRMTAEISERVQAEKSLTSTKTFLQNIIDSLPQQLMVINRDYTIALANRPVLELNGMDHLPESIHCHQMFHRKDTPCSGDQHPCPLAEILRTGKQATTEHIHTDAGGNPVIVEIVATPIFDEAGEICQIVESCHDITVRRHAEEQLRESEQKYRSILESIEEGYFESSLDGAFVFVNPSMCRIMGYDAERIKGMSNREYTSAETAKAMFRQFNTVFRTGAPCPISTYEVITGTGENRLLEVTAALMRGRDGEPVGFRGIARDVTDLADAQKALEESEERYRKLSEVTIEGICINDDSVIIDVNDAFARMFGYPRDALIGSHASKKLIAPEYWDEIAQIVRTNSNEKYEVVGVRKDGTRFPVEIEGRGVQYKGRSVRVVSARDITERKQNEQRLTMMHKMQAIGTLAGGIAHDFNNILAAIMGYTEICKLKVSPEQPMAAHLENILQASHRARDLVAQILSFSRSEEGALRPVQVGLIINETLKLLRPSIPATIDMVTRIEHGINPINADASQIHQILMNLCTNAAHAMRPDGGTLTIGLAEVDIKQKLKNSLAEVDPGAYVRLTVSDTGEGMDATTLSRAFEPYFTTKEQGEGTGLGLSVVHGIVQRFKGWMDVDSHVGRGTTISLFFPKIESKAIGVPAAVHDHPTGSETILVVDDDAHIVEMTGEILGSLGYRVIPATSAAEALEIFRQVPDTFNLVITDYTMPGMTGEKMSARLREIRPDIPVIISTGYSEAMNPQKAREIGINGFLMKPVNMSRLAQTVRSTIDDSQS